MDTKLAILLTAAQTLNETAIATALLVKAVHAWDGSDETSGDFAKLIGGIVGESCERNASPQWEQGQVGGTFEVGTPTAESAAPVEEVKAATPPAKPRTPRKPKAEVAKAPEVEQVQEAEPEVTKAPEPEVTKAPEPEVEQVQEVEAEAEAEAEVAKVYEPEVEAEAEAEAEAEVTKASEPEVEKPVVTKKVKEDVNPLVGKTAEERLTTLKQILTSGTALKNYTQADVRAWIQDDFGKTGLSLLTEEEQIAFYDNRLARFN